ncbi:MAG: hypothetical protein NTY04_03250 [Candidatus Staskawiczbacteria bacterium]|nr:hypothetical protein [Candidatus Staskawiczbacteria bacterium]
MTKLHEKVKSLKPAKEYQDRMHGCHPIELVRIEGCKLDQTYGTYTIELRITVKCAQAMVLDNACAEPHTRFGEYFAPMTVLQELFAILSIGQQARIFPDQELLAEDEKP